jgi:hypothetical protein
MDKQDLIKILVVVIAVLFLTEIFAFRGTIPFFNFGPAKANFNQTGTAIFNGTIRTYDPFLLLPADTSKSVMDDLKKKEGVKDVSLQTEGYVVETETRDDVYSLASYLRTRNVSSQSIANVVVPQELVVTTSTGTVNASAAGVVRVATEPLLDTDSMVTVNMTAIVSSDGLLLDYRSASILKQAIVGRFDAVIVGLDRKTYSYSIPWEKRTGLGDLSGFGTVDFRKVDSIVFTSPLTTAQVVAKKQFPYVVYIDPNSAMVEGSFSNSSQVALNFQDANYTLPPSFLDIVSNSTESEAPPVPFNATLRYSYFIRLVDPGQYDFSYVPLLISGPNAFGDNETLKVDISAVALGNKVMLVRSVSIPS